MLLNAFDYDRQAGKITNRRAIFETPDGLGVADGMAIDIQDRLWVAFCGGWCVGCIDPASGQLLSKVAVPVGHVTACAFGGPELRDLYITTARIGLDEAALTEQPHAGDLFVARMDVPGVAPFRFCG